MTYQIVPESAPFNAEQRAWLNGFLAGVLGVLDQQSALGGNAGALAAAASHLSPTLGAGLPSNSEAEETFPWHDPALTIADRMKLADGLPKERRLMAAMAQLNCGSCGYLCKTYAESIANGSEKNLTLCSPGGSDTAKAVRALVKDASAKNLAKSSEPAATAEAMKGTRGNPIQAKLLSSNKLNGLGSSKDTRHVAIDLEDSGLRYQVGDALGLWPTNCDQLVSSILSKANLDLHASKSFEHKCLRTITPELVQAAIDSVRQRPKQNGSVAFDSDLISRLEAFEDSDDMVDWDVLEFFEEFGMLGLSAQQVLASLNELRPRLYSIASSQTLFPNQVHLTVGRVEETVRNRNRKGVASTMLADRLQIGSKLSVFVHPSHGFTVPDNPDAPMIMVGPGTGVAPFVAFLQQRQADNAKGKNWLFFGDQRSSTDFLYQEQIESWQRDGLLSELDLAFSRDNADKVYVQHRMLARGAELFDWLQSGAYFFVCGDASRMASDVEKTLLQLISIHGKMPEASAKQYLTELSSAKRYVRDVY